ncbi:HNH endonuclease [Hymenobacter algoricola]|uniref:HNH nuclease domain-containing protein n=1 Tax=Hymenobacter algoricola TaxID=486267 RepID=A0ABP7NB21_9BACT
MKKMRIIGRDIDPETGDVSYFNPGYTSRTEALKGQRKEKPPTKGQKAHRRRKKKEHYAGCRPRPLFHDQTPKLHDDPAERFRLKQEVIRDAGHRCQVCGTGDNLTLDHIIPLSKGGGWHRANLQCLCNDCNQAKGDKMPYELAA